MIDSAFRYDKAGVDTAKAQDALGWLAKSIVETHRFRDDRGFGRPALGLGYYANVLELPGGQGLAIATDGVGTKIIVAELAGRYDTIPIDMIAMNVNDIICVGAEPFALVDYIAVGAIDADAFEGLGRGLLEGARQSDITIPGGEIAQVAELVRGHGGSAGLDLVGTAVGLVPWDRVMLGQDVRPGDAVIGIAANGLHSNGYTLARKILLDEGGLDLDAEIPELGTTLADELLRPTAIYVKAVLSLLKEPLDVTALLHITGDGFCNMNRIRAEVGFEIDRLPEPGAIYALLQSMGNVSDEEMFSVFNMGVGFCVVIREEHADRAIELIRSHGHEAGRIGHATEEHAKTVRLTQYGLSGGKDRLVKES